MFNPHPLHGVPFADRYWCQPVLSMHKSHHEDEVDFWNWEWKNRRYHRPLLWRDIALSYLDMADLTRKDDWDNGEWDAYEPAQNDPNRPHESPEACGSACEKAVGSGCFQWTHHRRQCWFVRSFRYGRPRKAQIEDEATDRYWMPEDQRYFAGWNSDNIRRWISEQPCEEVQWVNPSVQRIF